MSQAFVVSRRVLTLQVAPCQTSGPLGTQAKLALNTHESTDGRDPTEPPPPDSVYLSSTVSPHSLVCLSV